ncbi:hypothetical protein GQ42DRAFT_65377 [Ramicandelaber brevisporus]|nr:hypothetical protein GQ42DRAFT_65377 [Ramicandelaber brevisporus]
MTRSSMDRKSRHSPTHTHSLRVCVCVCVCYALRRRTKRQASSLRNETNVWTIAITVTHEKMTGWSLILKSKSLFEEQIILTIQVLLCSRPLKSLCFV